MLGAKIFVDFGKFSYEECIKKLNKQIVFIKDGNQPLKKTEIQKQIHYDEEKKEEQKNEEEKKEVLVTHVEETLVKNDETKTEPIKENHKDKYEEPKPHLHENSKHEDIEEKKHEVHHNKQHNISNDKTDSIIETVLKSIGVKASVSDWTETDVDNWFLEKKILYSIKQNISPCDGNVLGQLYKMSVDVPEFFYSCLRNDTKANLKDLAFFANQLRLLHEKKN
jgi:hypothetical protein